MNAIELKMSLIKDIYRDKDLLIVKFFPEFKALQTQKEWRPLLAKLIL
jgi:hypothetical protein